MQTISTFSFQNDDIRIVSIDGIAWFIAKDVLKVLDIKGGCPITRLEAADKSQFILNEGRGNPNVNIINLSGFYNVVAASHKPAAAPLLKWIICLIIEDINKGGGVFNWKSMSNTLTTQQEIRQTYTYIIYSKNKDMVKIGRSINPAVRIRCLETQLGESLKTLCVKTTHPNLEQKLHLMFKNHRAIGEWFSLTKQQIKIAINEINTSHVETIN